MKALISEIQNTTTSPEIPSSAMDIEKNTSKDHPNLFLQYNDNMIERALHEFSKSRYLYEETDSPDEFFLPYIWTNIVSS